MMQVELLVGKYNRMIGLAWYTISLQKYLSKMGVDYISTYPDYPLGVRAAHSILQPLGYDLKAFFTLFPVSAPLHRNTIKHFTIQQMASLFSFQKDLHPVIVTVHDIIPYMMRDHPEQNSYRRIIDRWVDNLAMKNLRYADCIISVSDYTRRKLVEKLGISGEKIRVVMHGLDLDVFKPSEVSQEFKERYQIEPKNKYILYVGSELPRKNLNRLLESFAMVKRTNPNARLIKIGSPDQIHNFQKLQDKILKLNLENEVLLFNHLHRDELISFYNLADVFVFPSLTNWYVSPCWGNACSARLCVVREVG